MATVTFTDVGTHWLPHPPTVGVHWMNFNEFPIAVRSGSLSVIALAVMFAEVRAIGPITPPLEPINVRFTPDVENPEPLITTVWVVHPVEHTMVPTGWYWVTVFPVPSMTTDVMSGFTA